MKILLALVFASLVGCTFGTYRQPEVAARALPPCMSGDICAMDPFGGWTIDVGRGH